MLFLIDDRSNQSRRLIHLYEVILRPFPINPPLRSRLSEPAGDIQIGSARDEGSYAHMR